MFGGDIMYFTGVCPVSPTKDKITISAKGISINSFEDQFQKFRIGRVECPLSKYGINCPFPKCKILEQYGLCQ